MALGAEGFTVLAILEARDRASEIFKKIDESLLKLGDTAKTTADTVRAAGDSIDQSLLSTASGADALDVAQARVDAAQARAAAAAREQAAAEQELLDAQAAAAGAADGDAAAQDRLAAAGQALTATQREAAASATALSDAQKLQADTAAAAAAKNDEAAASETAVTDAADTSGASLAKFGKVAGIAALGLGIAGGVMVKSAANFQDSTVHLVTDAGVAQKNLGMVQAGILKVSTATGQSAASITQAMYHIASSGYRAQNGLNVLKVAAEGARVGGASLDTTSKALVGTLTAYYGANLSAGKATKDSTSLMQQLIATVGSGDMRMQDLAGSLASVAPLAAAAHIKFAQVGGAIATMTSQGFTADRATQDLANTIRALENPSAQSTAEMAQLGLNSQTVASQLGKKGLTGTVQELTQAILSHMGKSGQVMLSAFNKSTVAAQDANIMLSKLPSSIQGVAKAYLGGSASYTTFYNATKGAGLQARTLAQQFAAVAGKAHGFSSILTSGSPAAQTYTAALRKLTGNATAMNTVMMLSGSNMGTFQANTAAIAAKAKTAGGNLAGWSKIQGTFNFKVQQAKTAVENTGIAIGSALLPAATKLLGMIGKIVVPIAEWTAKHQKLTGILFIGVTAIAATIAAVSLASKAFKAVKSTVDDVGKAIKGTAALFRKLGALSKKTADTQARDAQGAASAQESASAESASAQEAAAGEAAAAEETAAAESAAAQEEAAASSSAGWLAAAASTVAGWAKTGARMVAQAAVWVAENTAKVAVVVAENVAGAATTMAAWIAANGAMMLGIGALVALVAIAVYEIVTHWHSIVDGVKKAWNAVYDFISKVVRDVISFVKQHWTLIVGIITGPLGLAVVEIVKHWDQIKSFVSKAVSAVIGFVKDHWRLIVSILGGPLGLAVALVTRYWGDIKHWFTEGVSRVLGILRGLGGDVVSIGRDIVRGLWQGISGAGGWLLGQIRGFASHVVSSIGSFFGIGSPSKYTDYHGRMLGAGLAQGILASVGKVASAGRVMASAALGGTASLAAGGSASALGSSLAASAAGPAGGGAGGAPVINLYVTGNTVMSDSDTDKLVERIGKKLATITLPAAGHLISVH